MKVLDYHGLIEVWNKIKNLVSSKADKVSNATLNNLASLDANGNLKDSGGSWKNIPVPSTYVGTAGYVEFGRIVCETQMNHPVVFEVFSRARSVVRLEVMLVLSNNNKKPGIDWTRLTYYKDTQNIEVGYSYEDSSAESDGIRTYHFWIKVNNYGRVGTRVSTRHDYITGGVVSAQSTYSETAPTGYTIIQANDSLDDKVSKSGDTMSGALVNNATGNAIKVSHGTANQDAFFLAERSDQEVSVAFGVGANGVNHGIWSNKNGNWIISADTSNIVKVNADKASTNIYLGNSNVGATNKPMYLSSGKISEGSLYAGGTAVTLNGTSKGATTASFYAPTGAGTARRILRSNGSGAPTWNIPGIDYTINSVIYATGDTHVMKLMTLKGVTDNSYNNILLNIEIYFWNNQKAFSDLLYLGWSKNGNQGTNVSMAYSRLNLYANGSNQEYYCVRNVGATAATSTVDLYVLASTSGNSYGQFNISVLNSGNRDLNDIIEIVGTPNVTLPDNANLIPIRGKIGSADSANYVRYVHNNEINFQNVPTTGNKERTWFNYRNGDTDAADANNPLTDYYFGNRQQSTTGVTLHADKYNVAGNCTIQYNSTDQALDFVFE